MYKRNLSIIGTSSIVNQHIDSAKKNGFIIQNICTTNKKSKNINKISSLYNIKNVFYDWQILLDEIKDKQNHSLLIAPRIKDTHKILLEFCKKTKIKIFVEKPISLSSSKIIKLKKYESRIFIGYNRNYYHGIKYLKKKKLKECLVSVHSAESNILDLKSNSCHLIAILIDLFGSLKIKNRIKKKSYINCCLYNHNVNIIFTIYLKSSKNFEIEILKNKQTFLLKPIEKLRVYEDFKINKINNENFYNPKKIFEIDEYKLSKNKPGFDNQWQVFKQLVTNNNKFFNNITFGYKVINLIEKILK